MWSHVGSIFEANLELTWSPFGANFGELARTWANLSVLLVVLRPTWANMRHLGANLGQLASLGPFLDGFCKGFEHHVGTFCDLFLGVSFGVACACCDKLSWCSCCSCCMFCCFRYWLFRCSGARERRPRRSHLKALSGGAERTREAPRERPAC